MPATIVGGTKIDDRPKIKRRYRLLIGSHIQNELLIVDGKPVPRVDPKTKEQVKDADGNPVFETVHVKYKSANGDYPEFDAEIQGEENCLVKRFGVDKYQRVDLHGPTGRQRIWDPERETIEEFAAKVKAEQVAKPAPVPATSGNDGLDAMTVAALRELAEAEEIDVEHLTRKDDLIRRIRESKVGAR